MTQSRGRNSVQICSSHGILQQAKQFGRKRRFITIIDKVARGMVAVTVAESRKK